MIFIDCREGLSADMLLSALLGLAPAEKRADIQLLMGSAASRLGLGLTLMDIHDGRESGIRISYSTKQQEFEEVSYEEALAMQEGIAKDIHSTSALPRKILGHIFDAEAEAHGIPKERVHLHEIGRPQAMLNIACIGLVHSELEAAGAGEFVASTITTGKGIVVVSHGAVRVPAPASKILLRGLKHEVGDDPGERATPTGIASVKAMIARQSDDALLESRAKGIGFGTKRFGGRLGRTTVFWV